MSNVLFEEDGVFRAGTILSEAGGSLQVEHATGRRAKIKAAHVVLRFETPSAGELLSAASKASEGIELDFLWECAPQEEFGFLELAQEYHGHPPTPVEATALLLRLQSAPIYFHRKGRGRYRPAPADTLKAAIAAVERKRQQELLIDQYAAAMIEGRIPPEVAAQSAWLLVKPDKQSLEYRALDRACQQTHLPPQKMLLKAGAWPNARVMHAKCFEVEYFPRGVGFGAVEVPAAPIDALDLSPAQAFSIDDSTTTEIDDCLSVQTLPDGRLRVGIHIAAPALAIQPADRLDGIARERMSTVYTPGEKITMLPDAVVASFSLDEGRVVPALSLYVDLDEQGTRILARDTRIERIEVAANLRHDKLDALVSEAALGDPGIDLPQGPALRALWRLTLALCAEREKVRGKPEPRFRTDFSFYIDGENVRIVQRRRDAPLDRIVAEMMILANSEWGKLLADHQVPGIYRSQQAGRVRMTTHPLAHQGLGVAQYIWSTSPLRRYTDLVNQRQIMAVVRAEKPPYSPNDADLFSIMSAFDARYSAYADFQMRMERYWCLRWLEQEQMRRVEAVVVREDLVRLAAAPFYFRLADLPSLAAGRRIMVDVLERNEIDLTLSARFAELATGTGDTAADLAADQAGEALGDAAEEPSPPDPAESGDEAVEPA